MINYLKAAERLLSERGQLDKAADNLERRRRKAISRGAPEDLAAAMASPLLHASTSDTAEDLAARLELIEIEREIAVNRDTREAIDDALDQLDAQDAALLRAWYIQRRPKEEIAGMVNYSSSSTIYGLRNKALAAFALLYYGASALAST